MPWSAVTMKFMRSKTGERRISRKKYARAESICSIVGIISSESGPYSCMTASGSSKYHITRLGMRPSAASPHMLATYPVGTLEVRRLVGIARPYRCLTASDLDVAAGPHVYMRRSALTLGRVPYRVAAPEAGRSGVGVLEYRHLATDRAVVESVVHDVVAVGVQTGGHGVVVGKGVGRKYRIGLGEDTDAAQRSRASACGISGAGPSGKRPSRVLLRNVRRPPCGRRIVRPAVPLLRLSRPAAVLRLL